MQIKKVLLGSSIILSLFEFSEKVNWAKYISVIKFVM